MLITAPYSTMRWTNWQTPSSAVKYSEVICFSGISVARLQIRLAKGIDLKIGSDLEKWMLCSRSGPCIVQKYSLSNMSTDR